MSQLQEYFEKLPRASLSSAPRPQSGPAYWRSAWSRRHSLGAAVTWALLVPINLAAASWPSDPLIIAILVATSAVAALVLGSYVRPADPDAKPDSTCAAAPAMLSFAPTLMVSQQPATTATVALMSLIVVPALLIRLFGSRACPA